MNLLNKNVIRSVTIVSVFFCLLWLAGLGWAVGEYYAGKPDKIPEKNIVEKKAENKEELHIVALGDSLTRGTGDETGKGYVGILMDEIKEKSKQDVHAYQSWNYRSAVRPTKRANSAEGS